MRAERRAPQAGGPPSSRWWVASALALIAVFVAFRVTLLATSYDANVNWEEPVFLFSGMELARDGVASVLDHQDDLNHGGSVVLLLLSVPWIRAFGTSLLVLKGIAIAWSTATLVALLVTAWRYFSPRVALVLGLCFVVASPTLARLNVTLVGSHPESLLPCTLALAAYLAWTRCRGERSAVSAAASLGLGLSAGVAVWMSYVAATLVAPLIAVRAAAGRDRNLVLVAIGGGAGFAPWLLQNLWLRPHGAMLWRTHVAGTAADDPGGAAHVLAELAASYGWAWPGGELLLAASAAALLLVTLWSFRRSDEQGGRLALLPMVAAPYVGFVMLMAAKIPRADVEGYYQYRFHALLQVALFWVLALAIDRLARRTSPAAVTTAILICAAVALAGQMPLLWQGTSYTPDVVKDRARGCMVFGVAESDRSGQWARAVARLAAIRDDLCREHAFSGLGWGIGSRFVERRDVAAAQSALQLIADERLRWSACGGFNFLVSHAPAAAIPPEEAAAGAVQVFAVCRRPRS